MPLPFLVRQFLQIIKLIGCMKPEGLKAFWTAFQASKTGQFESIVNRQLTIVN